MSDIKRLLIGIGLPIGVGGALLYLGTHHYGEHSITEKEGTIFVAPDIKHYEVLVDSTSVWNGVLNKGQTVTVRKR